MILPSAAQSRPPRLAFTLLFLAALSSLLFPASAGAWGAMHSAITEGAFEALPQWQRELFSGQRDALIEFNCMIPDLVRAAANRKTLGRFALLPNGDVFTHEPHSRQHNVEQMTHYFSRAVEQIQANDLDEAARWAGCLLHFLEDCGSPAHSIPGDNQHGLMQDLLTIPEAYKDRPLHSLIEDGKLKIALGDYQPQLLGTTPDEAVGNLVERFNAMIRNARAQLIPILQGVFKEAQPEIDQARLRAATMDAQVAADALYTLVAIGKKRFEPAQVTLLDQIDLSALTPLEVVSQSYFPQNTYFSNPYFGYPLRNAILENGKVKQPLVLNVMENGTSTARRIEHGLGLGTHSRVTYVLPAKIYDRFECLVGLHATLGKEGALVFKVYADGEALFNSGVITGEDPAQKVSLPIWRVRELTIETESRNPVPVGKNYAVIGQPILFKAKAPPLLDQDKTR